MKAKGTVVITFILCTLLAAGMAVQAQAWDMGSWLGYNQGHHHGKYRYGPMSYRQAPGPRYGGCMYGYFCCGWPAYVPDRSAFGSTLSKGEAKKLVQWMIRCDLNLQAGNVASAKDGYEVEVVTRKGNRLVDTLFVDKDTAFVYPTYKPAGQ